MIAYIFKACCSIKCKQDLKMKKIQMKLKEQFLILEAA